MSDRRRLLLAKAHAHRLSRRTAVRGVGGGVLAAALAMVGGRATLAVSATPAATATAGAPYVVIRRYQLKVGKSMDELVRRVETGFVPIVRAVDGFIEYYLVVDDATGEHASISIFRDHEAADESTRRSADWIKADNITDFIEGPAEVTTGVVRVHAMAETTKATPTT